MLIVDGYGKYWYLPHNITQYALYSGRCRGHRPGIWSSLFLRQLRADVHQRPRALRLPDHRDPGG